MVEFPQTVAIETTNRCNARCWFCPNATLDRKRATMRDDLFEKIILDCASFDLHSVEPFLQGEPFADPRIFERLALIRERLPNTRIRINTNGAALTPQKAKALAGFRIEELIVSLNTADPDRYRNDTGLAYERTLSNLRHMASLNHGGVARNLFLRLTITPDTTWPERARFLALCARLGAKPLIVGLFNYKGDIQADRPPPAYPCAQIRRVVILVDGSTALCCQDHEGAHGWGPVTKRHVLDVFNAEPAVTFRRLHRGGLRPLMDPCGRCNFPRLDRGPMPLASRARFLGQKLVYSLRHRHIL